MLISLFGVIDSATISQLASRGHQFLVSDSPTDTKTVTALENIHATFAVQKAAWQNIEHPLAKVGQRLGVDNKLEEYNSNGGFVRDAIMVEKSDASIIGEGVKPGRLALLDRTAAEFDRPLRTIAVERVAIDRQTAEAELDACFQMPAADGKPPRKPRKAKTIMERVDDLAPETVDNVPY